jgi:hypothetical protein
MIKCIEGLNNEVYRRFDVIEGLTDILGADANWETDTLHEDALIMNTFYYKVSGLGFRV